MIKLGVLTIQNYDNAVRVFHSKEWIHLAEVLSDLVILSPSFHRGEMFGLGQS